MYFLGVSRIAFAMRSPSQREWRSVDDWAKLHRLDHAFWTCLLVILPPNRTLLELPPRSLPVRCNGMCRSPMKCTRNFSASLATSSREFVRVSLSTQSSSKFVTFRTPPSTFIFFLPAHPRFPGKTQVCDGWSSNAPT